MFTFFTAAEKPKIDGSQEQGALDQVVAMAGEWASDFSAFLGSAGSSRKPLQLVSEEPVYDLDGIVTEMQKYW